MSITQQDYDSIPDDALPVIQVNGKDVEDLQKMSAEKQDEVSATLEAIKRHTEEGKILEAKKAAHIKTVLERKAAANRDFDLQLAALGYAPETPEWVQATKAAVALRKEAAPPAAPATVKPLRCKICGVEGHDARLKIHRLQKVKKPLTEKELAKLAK